MLWCASAFFHSDRSLLLDATFRSPAATADLSIHLHGQVNVPGLHLRSNSKISAQPVRSRAPVPVRLFVRRSGYAHRAAPVAKSDFETPCLCPNLGSPSGPLDPFGSKRSARSQTRKLTLASRPIFPRSPPRQK